MRADPPQVQLAVCVQAKAEAPYLHLFFKLLTPPVMGGMTAAQLFITGAPQIWSVSADDYPTQAVISQADEQPTIRLTYTGGAPTVGSKVIIGSYDPAVRSEDGGYMAPAVMTVTS